MIKGIKLQPREKIIAVVAVLALLVYGFYSFWFTRYDSQISGVQSKIQSLQSEVSKNKSLLAKQKDYEALKVNLAAQATELQHELPTVDSLPTVMQDVESIFLSNGAAVKNMALDTGAAGKGLDPALDFRQLKVSFTASYPSAFSVVKALETNHQRTYTVGDFSLRRSDKPSPVYTGSMTVQIYFARTPLPGYGYQPMVEAQGKADPFTW